MYVWYINAICLNCLRDIVQSKPSCFPISSHELFNILDDASEKNTWLCGTTESMQIYVFDGEAGKIGLEPKKLVACISFVLEHKLVIVFLMVISFLLIRKNLNASKAFITTLTS